jgi:HEAT repeats
VSKTAKRFVWLGLLIIATVLALSLIWILRDEPRYQNRELSSWIADLPRPIKYAPISGPMGPVIRPLLTQKEKTAGEAIRAIGTNALPVLVRMARRTDGRMTSRVIAWINKQKFLGLKIASADQHRVEACSALQELGVQAIPAWTEILLDEKIPLQTREFAAVSLAHVRNANSSGPLFSTNYRVDSAMNTLLQPLRDQAWRALTKGLDSTNAAIRSNTASYVGGFGPQAKGAIPKLIEHAEDPDPGVRAACIAAMSKCEPDTALGLIRSLKYERGRRRAGAAASLGLLKQRPEESVQALMLTAQDNDYYVREAAISALADFKSKASNAIPMLQIACNDTNKFVRRAATNTLLEIMPKPTIEQGSEALSTK